MQQQQGLQQQRGRLPGGDPRAMAMQRFQASRGMRPPAPGGARPIAPQVQPGMPRGTFNPGPNIPHQVPPPDRRVIPGPSQGNYGPRLRQMNANMRPRGRYAKGGKVKRAVAALERARGMLHDSDPDFDHIADLMKKDIPGAGSLAAKIRKVANAKAKTKDPDEFRPAWQAIEKDFKALKKSLSETE